MSSLNPNMLGVAANQEVVRPNVNTTTPGKALVTQVLVDSSLHQTYSGAEPGTGKVTISLPTYPSVAGKTLTTVVVDGYGRVVGGTEGSLGGDFIANMPATRQVGGFVVDTGDVTNLVVLSLTTESLSVTTLTLNAPLAVASGGTGVTTTQAHTFFAGPIGVTGAPGFRGIAVSDLPEIPFSSINPHPTTASGYGILDVYSKTESDGRFAATNHTHSQYEPTLPVGSITQYFRGDKSLANLTTDVIQETGTKKYYTDTLARHALSASGTNIQYDSNTGIIGITSTPEFASIHLDQAPVLGTDATTKSYVDTTIQQALVRESLEEFVVSNPSNLIYTLTHTPIPTSVFVSLNGLLCTSDTTVSSQSIVVNAGVALVIGDKISVHYRY